MSKLSERQKELNAAAARGLRAYANSIQLGDPSLPAGSLGDDIRPADAAHLAKDLPATVLSHEEDPS